MKKILKWGIIVIVLLAVIGAVAGGEDDSEPELVTNEENEAVEETEEVNENGSSEENNQEVAEENPENDNAPKFYSVGDIIELDNMLISINGVKTSTGTNDFDQPDDGYKYLMLDVSISNKTDDFVNISSMLMFNLVDESGMAYDLSFFAPGKGSLDGGIGPGRKMRGEVAFDVPKDKNNFELEIDPEFWSYGISIVEINEENINQDIEVAFSDDTTDDVKHFNIGDQIKLNNTAFTVNETRTSSGSDFDSPKDGYEYFIINATVENTGEESASLSSLLQFKVVDSDGLSYENNMFADTKGSLDGELAPTRKMTGEIAFEVPKDADTLELEFIDSFFDNGLIVVDLK